MELGLVGRRALVTGATRGIGRACATSLAEEGAMVCGVGRDPALLAELDALEFTSDGQVTGIAADLTSAQGCHDAFAACQHALGGVDILVNVAGAATVGGVLDLSRDQIDEALRLKLHSYLTLAQLVAPGMVENGWGRIVNVAGGAGSSPTATNLPTSFANVTVLNLTRGLSDELAPSGVLVNAVCPGFTATDRARSLIRSMDAFAGMSETEAFAVLEAATPARRIAEPGDIAAVITFLSSAACSYVHGNAIYLDGGARRATP